MATLAKQSIKRSGLAPAFSACAGGGDRVSPSDRTFVHVKNGSGGALTVTFAVPASKAHIPDLPIANLAVSVPAGGERMIGPLRADFFADDTDGLVGITYSGVTSLTIAALEVSTP